MSAARGRHWTRAGCRHSSAEPLPAQTMVGVSRCRWQDERALVGGESSCHPLLLSSVCCLVADAFRHVATPHGTDNASGGHAQRGRVALLRLGGRCRAIADTGVRRSRGGSGYHQTHAKGREGGGMPEPSERGMCRLRGARVGRCSGVGRHGVVVLSHPALSHDAAYQRAAAVAVLPVQ